MPGLRANTTLQIENRKAAERHEEKQRAVFRDDAMLSVFGGAALVVVGIGITVLTLGGCIAYGAIVAGIGLIVNGFRRARQL